MNKPLITIVIPVYNGANYMREAIDSVLNQTYKNIEIIVVNDGSIDNTEQIAKSYGNKIRYFSKKNGGVGSALNLALKEMRGDYFSWLSHDDVYYPAKVKKQIQYLASLNNKDVVLYSNYALINDASQVINTIILDHEMLESKPEYAVLRGAINGNTLLIPQKAFKDYGYFDEKLTCTQDYAKWSEILKTYNFIHIPEVLIKYRIHSSQDTQKNPKFISEGDNLWIKMMKELPLKTKERLEGSEANFYNRMNIFLKTTPYIKAIEFAEEMFSQAVLKKKKNRFFVTYVAHSSAKDGAEKAMISAIDGLLEKNVYIYVILPSPGPLEEDLCERKIDYSFEDIKHCLKSEESSDSDARSEIFENALKLSTFLQNLGPDVIISVTSVINEGAIAARIIGVPHVWIISEFGRKEHCIEYLAPEKERLQFVNEYSDKIFFVSETLRNYYQNKMDMKNSVVFPPLLVKEVLDKKVIKSNKFFKNKNSLKIALAGNIHRGKGQKDAILAIKELVKEGRNKIELVIVGSIGEEKYYKELRKIINKENLSNQVVIMSQTDNVIGLFLESDIVLICSVFEAFGRVTAEAMLCKKPVIGANSGATPELIKDFENGFLYKPGDYKDLAEKIDYFIENNESIKKFGEQGYKIIKNKINDKYIIDKYFNELYELKNKKKAPIELKGNLLKDIKLIFERKDRELDKRNHLMHGMSFEISSIKSSKLWMIRRLLVKIKRKMGLN